MRVEQTVYEVPGWGVGTLWTQGELVLAHDFDFVDTRLHAASDRASIDAGRLVALLTAFFAGEDALRAVPLDLSGCTPFQRCVIETLRGVPRGEVVSYGELAALAGFAGAQRAVGTLCARNRFALLVPCHRVVAADGIGGYGTTGVAVKRRLLALEGVRL